MTPWLADRSRRNVLLLAACQALSMSAMSINMTVTALTGASIAPDPSYATVPLALQFLGTMMTSMPASLLMRRIGRRAGFMVGVAIGLSAAALAAAMVFDRDFVGFCIASMMLGSFQGFALFYRHAAADTAAPEFRSKAISLVLAGGVFSAIVGPELSKWSFDLFAPVLYAGSFVAMMGLQVAILGFLAFIDIPKLDPAEAKDTGRPLMEIARNLRFVVAVIGGMVGFSVMSFIMTATPLAVVACGFGFTDAAFIIQWHALGMFAPSFVTGSLIARFGVLRVMMAGALIYLACVAVDISGVALEQFFVGLVLLGIGWNFLFVGGTTLLAECHTPSEKAKVQGFNDFLVFSTVTVASFSSGYLLDHFGWVAVNIGVLPLVTAVIIALVWLMRHPRAATA